MSLSNPTPTDRMLCLCCVARDSNCASGCTTHGYLRCDSACSSRWGYDSTDFTCHGEFSFLVTLAAVAMDFHKPLYFFRWPVSLCEVLIDVTSHNRSEIKLPIKDTDISCTPATNMNSCCKSQLVSYVIAFHLTLYQACYGFSRSAF